MASAAPRFDTGSIWSMPDWSVLNAGRRPPVPMPAGLFGPAWPILQAIGEDTSTPPDYAAMGLIASCASLIGGKRRVKPYPTSNWSEPCILWIGAVGDASSRKSPPLEALSKTLQAIEHDYAEHHVRAVQQWRCDSEVAKAAYDEWKGRVKKAMKAGEAAPDMPSGAIEPDAPHRRRTIVRDATPEAVAAILAHNPQGVMHFRDELAGWLQSFERYAPGGREFWLEAYGGRPFTIDRKSSPDPIVIPFNGVTVLGGIQPDKMAGAFLDSPDDGLVARFLWAWPDKLQFQRPRNLVDLGPLELLYRRLESLAWGIGGDAAHLPVTIPLAPDAADIFEHWQRDNAALDEDAAALFKSFVGKMDGTVLRLALIGEMIRWAWNGGAEPTAVSPESLAGAAEFVDDYAKPMAQRVYGDAALPLSERNAAVLARYIRKHRLRAINKRDLKRSPHKAHLPGLRQAQALDAAIEHLVDAAWLLRADTGDDPGRPREDYLVNPAVLEPRQ